MSREAADIVVVGGGLSGLAAAVTAENAGARVVVLEAADHPGGLARSYRVDGYTFDCSGHLLHLARPETRSLVESVTESNDWALIDRRSAVVIEDAFVPYPFQLHLAHAPRHVRDACLATLPETEPELPEDPGSLGLDEWIEVTLGAGIGRHFMVPYNEKVSTVPVSELTCHWLGRFVPRPAITAIREGAESSREVATGYNTSFLYPREGGIDMLWRALAARINEVCVSAWVTGIDVDQRVVRLASGEEVAYREAVISSAPLPEICRAVSPADASLRLGERLRSNEVLCVNLGLRHIAPRFKGYQWLYLPEDRFAAYRVGFYNGFAPSMSPEGRAGVYVEIAHRGDRQEQELVAAAVEDMVTLGTIRDAADVEVVLAVPMPRAYVIHDRDYAWVRERVLNALAGRSVHAVGRYGRWEYASMEDALWQGIEAAEHVLGLSSTAAASERRW